eukprot:scaffold6967_cov123-Isochrysis_galbana.AAC.8
MRLRMCYYCTAAAARRQLPCTTGAPPSQSHDPHLDQENYGSHRPARQAGGMDWERADVCPETYRQNRALVAA